MFSDFKIDLTLRIGEIINFLITIGLALYINYFLNNFLNNKRNLKTFIIDEIKKSLEIIETIDKYIEDNFEKKLTSSNKNYLKNLLIKLSNNINIINFQIEEFFPKKINEASKLELENTYFEYKDKLTGDKFMNSDFKIDDYFLKESRNSNFKVQKKLKALINKINKL